MENPNYKDVIDELEILREISERYAGVLSKRLHPQQYKAKFDRIHSMCKELALMCEAAEG